MLKIDLHIHTNCSDGVFSPREVLELAQKNNFQVISITDHDTFDGYRVAAPMAEEYGVKIIPGVEVSSVYRGKDVHILGYNVDPENKKVHELLISIQKGRYNRAKKVLNKLASMGINIGFDKVRGLAGDNALIGRPHIARALVEEGYCKTKQEAFDTLIGDDCPAYFPKPAPDPKKIIKIIKKAGGIPVLAHPYTLKNDEIVHEIIAMGICGMEVYCAKAFPGVADYYEQIALDNDLIRTGGSDFHGDGVDLEVFSQYTAPGLVLDELGLDY